ncbi:hypothetical protein H6F86_07860 [Phormidium sp. FACHB-592]|uniref:Uncharacterized protein n=1 Tax=Stenomitos frigidus AS-A4 TaxID=2933935 RepID=A0ABV0KHI5_9CYAN|nr:hypothetical protein [Phormidium sp. FACHB-592]MBD2073802.1 hypothetical protein [Phormidium sp. FACHB-592]
MTFYRDEQQHLEVEALPYQTVEALPHHTVQKLYVFLNPCFSLISAANLNGANANDD